MGFLFNLRVAQRQKSFILSLSFFSSFFSQSTRTRGRQDLVENYLSVLVKAFIDAKLIDSLIEIMKDTNRFLAVRATILLGEIINLANRFAFCLFFQSVPFCSCLFSVPLLRVLPRSMSSKIQVLPAIFKLGASFDDEVHFHFLVVDSFSSENTSLIRSDSEKRCHFGHLSP